MTSNKVFINDDDILEIHVVGDQNNDSVMAMGDESIRLLNNLKAENKAGLILDDISQMGQTDTGARQAVSKLAKTMPYNKAAMLGTNNILLRVGTRILLQAIGLGSKIKYFEDKAKATTWLKS